MNNSEYIEAFVHCQLGIEKILWDKIVGVFSGEKASKVREAIDSWKKPTWTSELVKWAYFLGAIDHDECEKLGDFNDKRNKIVHRQWWFGAEYKESLKKGIDFLDKNGLS